MHVEPQAEHRWLENFIGEWTMETEMDMGPEKGSEKLKGKEAVRRLGEIWIMCEGEGDMPGGDIGYTVLTLGYDPAQNCFVGTFIGSMMTHLWIYEKGTLDEAQKVLTLNSKGPSFTGEGMAQYQDIIELVDADHRILRAQVQNKDGTWDHIMTAHYYRKK